MASNDVVVRLQAAGQAAFTAAMDSAAKSLGKVDSSAGHADKSTAGLSATMGKSTGKLKSTAVTMAKWAGGAAAVYKGGQYLRSAVTGTMDLAKSTMALQRSTGLETDTASQWAEVLKVRGINTKAFQVGLVKLSKTMQLATHGNAKAAASLAAVGVSQDAIKTGDVNAALMQSADVFSAMTNPAEKAAKAQELFGKQGQNLLPIMSKGSQGIQDQLDMAARYGATLTGKGAKGAADLIAKQRELAMASDGVKVQLGQALLPIMAQLATVLTQVVAVMQPLLRNATALKIVLALLTTAFITLKVATLASTIAALSFNAALLLIPLAVVALIAGLILAYRKVDWFRAAVDAAVSWIKNALISTFNWIKTHWVLLASILGGPFVAAAIQIVKHWDQIKSATRGAISSVINTVKRLPGAFLNIGKDLVRAIVDGIKAAPHAILDAIKGLLPGKVAAIGSKIGLWAAGGLVPTRQWGIVGERGPELLQLPGGTRITPLSSPALTAPTLDSGAGAGGTNQTTARFYLDRRLVATAVAEDTADQKARR